MWNKIRNLFFSKEPSDIQTSSEQSKDDVYLEALQDSNLVLDEADKTDLSPTALTHAIKRAVDEFGVCILNETRFTNIIKDYNGFKEIPSAEIVIKTLIKTQAINRLNNIHEKNPQEIANILLLEISRSKNQYGFSEEVLKHVYVSIVAGLGGKVHFTDQDDINPGADKFTNEKHKSAITESLDNASNDSASEDFVLDIRNIPFSLSYRTLRNKLCKQLGGTIITNYDIDGNKIAYFICNYNGKKNVKFSVRSDRSDNKTTQLNISYGIVDTPVALKETSKEAFALLKKIYGDPTITFEGDFDAYLDYLNIWKEDTDEDSFHYLNLQAFLFDEGSVICSFIYTSTEFILIIGLTPRNAENQDILTWRFQKPASFQLLPPMSSDANSFDDEDDDEDCDLNSEDNNEMRIAIHVSKIISDMLCLDINSIGLNTDMNDLCEWGLDYLELQNELSTEMDVDVDFDELMSCETLFDVVTLVIWHLEND